MVTLLKIKLAGVRLSGKINDDTRIGFLNVLTDEDLENEIAQNNNSLLTFRKKCFQGQIFLYFFK